jgi:hypothetical protein
MRGFVLGLLLIVGLSVTVLSLRPGGLRRQMRFTARRLRIFLVLGGVYVLASGAIRLLFTSGPVVDFGPPALAIVLALVFVVAGQNPPDSVSAPDTTRR